MDICLEMKGDIVENEADYLVSMKLCRIVKSRASSSLYSLFYSDGENIKFDKWKSDFLKSPNEVCYVILTYLAISTEAVYSKRPIKCNAKNKQIYKLVSYHLSIKLNINTQPCRSSKQ
jgi:hypothetical protein